MPAPLATVVGRCCLALALCPLAGFAPAQGAAEAGGGDGSRPPKPDMAAEATADRSAASGAIAPTVPTATFAYDSVLGSFADRAELDATTWKEANETVARIGGWRAYARERDGARVPDPVAAYLSADARDGAEEAFARVALALASEPLGRALEVRRAWVEAVAAKQSLAYVERLHESAEATDEMTRRMVAIGNASGLTHARAQVLRADVAIVLARARYAALAARERLRRTLGPARERLEPLELPARLPALPDTPLPPEAIAASFERTLTTMRANARSPASAPDTDSRSLRSNLHESYVAYRTRHDIATLHHERILPLRATISEERLYRYNGMLSGVFELLDDSRDAMRAVLRAIAASRHFWIAETALRAAMGGQSMEIEIPAVIATEIGHGGGAYGDTHGDTH